MSKYVEVNEEVYKQFQAALMLTGEDEQAVLSELISRYAHKAFESVMGKKVETGSDTNNRIIVNTMTKQEQKQLFMSWFRGLTRNGKPYNPVTISGYTGRIENACNDPVFSAVPVNNLFTITDLKQFLDIQRQIKACPGYAEFDAKSHNGFTAALKKYEEFLRFQENGNTVQPYPKSTPIYQPSNLHRWTEMEDEICCKRFLECYVVKNSEMDTVQFLQMLSREVPDVPEGSLRMKIQNVKYLASLAGLKDTSTIKGLSQYSSQCERVFKKALMEMRL